MGRTVSTYDSNKMTKIGITKEINRKNSPTSSCERHFAFKQTALELSQFILLKSRKNVRILKLFFFRNNQVMLFLM